MAAIDDLDLSLLVALDALLTERHVTRAAARLGVAQSSMSHTLRRLRAQLGDPLLVRGPAGMEATPRAQALAAPLHAALAELRRVLREGADFDPATTTRTFSVACPDLLAPLLPALLAALERDAPGVRLSVTQLTTDGATAVAHGSDLALGPAQTSGPGARQRAIGAVHWCVLARQGHPVTRAPFTTAAWCTWPHVMVRTGRATANRVEAALEAAGLRRSVRVTVPGFLTAPLLVAQTDHLFATLRELAGPLLQPLGLVALAPPLPLDAVPVVAVWHERMHADAGHRWFRGRVVAALRALLREGTAAPHGPEAGAVKGRSPTPTETTPARDARPPRAARSPGDRRGLATPPPRP